MSTPNTQGGKRPLSAQLSDPQAGDRWSDLDDLVADPLVERHAPRQSDKKAGRLLAILDELAQKGLTR